MQNDESTRTIEEDYHPLDPNIVAAERIVGAVVLAAMVVFGLIGWLLIAFLVLDGIGWQSLLCGLGIASFLTGLAVLFWFDPLWKHRTTRWRETDGGFELKRGYIWWHHMFVPRERIQHTDVVQGPILRRFEMATLVINTAGTHEYSISVEGLPLKQAEALRSSLLPRRRNPLSIAEGPEPAIPVSRPASGTSTGEPSDAVSAIESSTVPEPWGPEPLEPEPLKPEQVESTEKPNRLGPEHEQS